MISDIEQEQQVLPVIGCFLIGCMISIPILVLAPFVLAFAVLMSDYLQASAVIVGAYVLVLVIPPAIGLAAGVILMIVEATLALRRQAHGV